MLRPIRDHAKSPAGSLPGPAAFLLLLPAILLPVLAAVAIRREALAIRSQASREATVAAELLLERLTGALARLDPRAAGDDGASGSRIVFRAAADGSLQRPRPYDPVPRPGPPSPAFERVHTLLEEEEALGADDVLAALDAMEPFDSGDRSPAGLPLAPLVALEKLRLARRVEEPSESRGAEGIVVRQTALVEAALGHPSALTPRFLEAALGDAAGPALARWRADEDARSLHRAWRRLATPPPAEPPAPRWLDWRGAAWLVLAEHDPGGDDGEWSVAAWPETRVRHHLAAVAAASAALPAFAAPRIRVAGRPLTGPPSPPSEDAPVLASAATPGPAAGTAPPTLAVELVLANPAALAARVRARGWWIGGGAGIASLAAVTGFLALRRAVIRERRLAAEKDGFVAAVSHELRTPIASIRLMAESLESRRVADEDRRARYFALIGEECRRLGDLVEGLLDHARLDEGHAGLEFEETDLGALARAVADRFRPAAERKGVDLQVAAPEEPVSLACDPGAIERLLVNLVDNALKFGPSDGGAEVIVSVEGDDDEARLTVADQGEGIPAAEHARIFERFYRRGSENTRRTTGTGLGLSLVAAIARAHHGSVAVRSRPGAGAAFTVTLPRRSPPAS